MTDEYYGRTDAIIARGGTPICPHCGKRMFAADDHGRFACFCQGIGMTTVNGVDGTLLPTPRLPQINTAGMADADKAKIPAINRLDEPPTAAEAAYFELMLTGDPNVIGTPEHAAAVAAIEEERSE